MHSLIRIEDVSIKSLFKEYTSERLLCSNKDSLLYTTPENPNRSNQFYATIVETLLRNRTTLSLHLRDIAPETSEFHKTS